MEELSTVAGIKTFVTSQYGDQVEVKDLRIGHVIFLHEIEGRSMHDIVSSIAQDVEMASVSVNKKSFETSVARIIKDFKKKKRTGLNVPRNQLAMKGFLEGCVNVPLTLSTPTSAPVTEPQFSEAPVCVNVPDRLPTSLRGDCEKCSSVREESAKSLKEVKQKLSLKIKDKTKDLASLRQNFGVKYVNQFKRRKLEQISVRDKKIKDNEVEIKSLKKLKLELERRNKVLEGDNRILKHRVKILERKNKRLLGEVGDTKTLQKTVNELNAFIEFNSSPQSSAEEISTRMDGRTYDSSVRKTVYNCLLSNVPVESIGHVIAYTVTSLTGKKLAGTPSPFTCAQMMRELGILSDLQSAEVIMEAPSCCLAWDATTLDGRHINEVHINTPHAVVTLNTQQLPGGKACDYARHITETLKYLSALYADFMQVEEDTVLRTMKAKMLSTLTDRAAANHATVALLEDQFGRSLLELNCQLHPLDGLANAARSTLKQFDVEHKIRSKSFGSDCQAANVLHLVSKLRYKAKGDPTGFKAHLRANGLPCGTFPRYVGNRLHVLFHLAGKVFQHKNLLLQFVEGMCSSHQMSSALKEDLKQPMICHQLQALGLIGKYVTGPWMALFYTSLSERNHFELSQYLKCAVQRLQALEHQADEVIAATTDIFGRPVVVDETLVSLQIADNIPVLSEILSRIITAFLRVLNRQLARYLHGNLANPPEELLNCASAAPVHNIWAERNLGMYDAQARRAPNASVAFLDAKCKATFNKTMGWLDGSSSDRQEQLINFAARTATKSRRLESQHQQLLQAEILKRLKDKLQSRDMSHRRKVEKDLRAAVFSGRLSAYSPVLSDFDDQTKNLLRSILEDPQALIGKLIAHAWFEDGAIVSYLGRILKTGRKTLDVTVSYWKGGEEEEDACDYKLKIENFLADIALGDLTFM